MASFAVARAASVAAPRASARPSRASSSRGTSSAIVRRSRRDGVVVRAAEGDSKKTEGEEVGAGLKAVWYGAEAVGKVVGATKEKAPASPSASATAVGATLTREQTVALLKEDYDSSYFVSGVGEMAAYDPDCEFADPFVSFKGVDRFKQNVGNLGGMMEDIDLKITGWEEGESELVTSWRFSCVLDLPWRPKLAAAGGTTHEFDPATGKVVRHVERWEVQPGKVVSQLLVPSSKIPENRWEVFMFSLSDGDYFGMWLAASPAIIKLTGPWVAVSLVFKALGVSAEGTPLGAVDSLAFWLLLIAGVAEPVKFFKGIIGS